MRRMIRTMMRPANRSEAERILAVVRCADQDGVKADLAKFFGPRPAAYLENYRATRNRGEFRMAATICWVCYPFVFPWLLYRRLYSAAGIMLSLELFFLILSTALGMNEQQRNFILTMLPAVIVTVLGKGCYVQSGLRCIAMANDLRLVGQARDDYLRRAGGVSIAGALGGVALAACIVIAAMVPHQAEVAYVIAAVMLAVYVPFPLIAWLTDRNVAAQASHAKD